MKATRPADVHLSARLQIQLRMPHLHLECINTSRLSVIAGKLLKILEGKRGDFEVRKSPSITSIHRAICVEIMNDGRAHLRH